MPVLPENPNLLRCYLPERLQSIVLAAGHPWGAQAFFSRLLGVASCTSGYVNGNCPNPDFALVDRGRSGYAFAVEICYSPDLLPLERLLEIFFSTIDASASGHQGADWGSQYRTGIYFQHESDLPIIRAAFAKQRDLSEGRLTSELQPLRCFFPAEVEQQHYLEQHPEAYCSLDLNQLNRWNEGQS